MARLVVRIWQQAVQHGPMASNLFLSFNPFENQQKSACLFTLIAGGSQ